MENALKRVVILNNVYIVEKKQGFAKSEWQIENTMAPAPKNLKSGIYALNTAKKADLKQSYTGQIIYIDNNYIYQKVSNGLVKHVIEGFKKLPKVGENVKIESQKFSCVIENENKRINKFRR